MNKNKKNILICPLEWGLGHATRCMPIINKLIELNTNVIIAGDGRTLKLLEKEFPDLKTIKLSGYNIYYPKRKWMELSMLSQIPKIFYNIYQENRDLKKIIGLYNIDIVISDNRFGLWSSQAYSIYMTHQVLTKCPWFMKYMEYPLYKLHQFFIKQYNECWIPDYKGQYSLAGDLSNKMKINKNTFHIGPLSRFSKLPGYEIDYDILVIISGPEPQRSVFEKLITKHCSISSLNTLIVGGKTEGSNSIKRINDNTYQVDYLNSENLNTVISKSKYILCRSGYSSIMDMVQMKKQAILIPTPGQTEQEYLADTLYEKKFFYKMSQNNIDLELAVKKMGGFCPPSLDFKNILNDRISHLVNI